MISIEIALPTSVKSNGASHFISSALAPCRNQVQRLLEFLVCTPDPNQPLQEDYEHPAKYYRQTYGYWVDRGRNRNITKVAVAGLAPFQAPMDPEKPETGKKERQ